MQPESIPVLWGHSLISSQRTIFSTLDKEIIIEAPGIVIRQILDLCDGRRNVAEIIEEASKKIDRESLVGFLEDIFREGVIVDGRNLVESFWKAVVNPMIFPVEISSDDIASLVTQAIERHRSNHSAATYKPSFGELASIIARRKSTRVFSGCGIPFQSLVDLLWSAYGECTDSAGSFHRTVPSAGALYPLSIHAVLLKQVGDFYPGVYEVSYDNLGSVGLKISSEDTFKFVRALLDPTCLRGACGAIVVAGSFLISNQKYGNRSMLYVALEAGHVAQNVLLEATRQNIATVEIGGFTDELLADSLNLPKGRHPLTLIAFGKEDELSISDDMPPEIDWAIPLAKYYKPGFALASVRLSPERSWSHGRDPSPDMALKKALSEAREWTACGCIPDLIHASYKELDNVIDPNEIISFHPDQYNLKGFPFTPFSKSVQYAWTKGYDLNGKEFLVLADHAYFPYFPQTPYYCYSNSSGCAAHPDEQVAIEKGTLELVERDAFMNAYLCKLDRLLVTSDTLPDNIRRRVAQLEAIGFDVRFIDHSLDFAPVVFVFAQSEEYSFTTCASCSDFDVECAMDHALTEVEASILYRLQHEFLAKINPRGVIWPNDHGRLYGQKLYFHRADFLVASCRKIPFSEVGRDNARSWSALLDRFNEKGLRHLVVPLTLSNRYGGDNGHHIVRTIVQGLTQMTFGYRQEPGGMRRIYEVAEKFGRGRLSYRDLTKFPHPFE